MYPHSSSINMLQQAGRMQGVARPCCSDRALRITIYVLGALCLVCWAFCIAAILVYCGTSGYTRYGSIISIPVNVGYVYVTCRIIFLISGSTTVTPEVLVDLQRLNARLVALIVVGFSVLITASVWFADNVFDYYDTFNAIAAFFGTSFGFLLAIMVVGLSAGLHDQYKKQVARPDSVINASPQQYVPDQEIPLQLNVQSVPPARNYPRYPPPPVPKPEGYYLSR